jgi:hypothetical protein
MDHSADKTLTPVQEKNRLSRLRLAEWTNRFAARLKANALWTKLFLHGSK